MVIRKLLVVAFVCIVGFANIFGQKTVSGIIKSAETEKPVPGATIAWEGLATGMVSDINGEFEIALPSDTAILVVEFIGKNTERIEVTSNTKFLEIFLDDATYAIDDVVISAMGIPRTVKSLSYSRQNINEKNIFGGLHSNVAESLRGKVAGMQIDASSGMPGASNYMTLRGARFFVDNNQPLIVVDGQPVENQPIFTNPGDASRISGSDASSRLDDINPDDIASIEILKGTGASALYGLRASKGVLLITTKKGKTHTEKPIVRFSTSYTQQQVTRIPEIQKTYAQGNDGAFSQNTSGSWGPPVDSLAAKYFSPQLGDSLIPGVYNNIDPFFNTGHTYTTHISLSNASETGNYHTSIGYQEQQGVIPSTGLKQYTAKFSGDMQASDKFTIGVTSIFTQSDVDKLPSGSNLSNPLFTVYYAPITYNLERLPYAEPDNPYQQIHYRSTMDNPYWSVNNNDFNEKNNRFIGNIRAEYKLFDPLKLHYQVGVDYLSNFQKEVYELGSGETGGRGDEPSGGQITDFAYARHEFNSNLKLVFNRKFYDKLGVNAVAGNEFYHRYIQNIKTVGSDFEIGGYHNVRNTSSQQVSENIYQRRTIGYYMSATFDFEQWVYLNVSGRNDVVSNLAEGNRSYFYPSVGVSFIPTDAFNYQNNILNMVRLRANWSEVGQPYEGDYLTNIFLQGRVSNGFLTDGIRFPLNNQNAFSRYSELRRSDLKPQNTQSFETGVDIHLFNNRINIDYTYYTSVTRNQIFPVPVAPSTGYSTELRNAGELESKGHELMLRTIPVKISDFDWNLTFNFTTYQNKVLSLADGVTHLYLGGFDPMSIRALEGESYPSIYGIGYLRDNQGEIVVLDAPGNPYHGMPLQDPEPKKIGNVQPEFLLGVENTFTYKTVSLSVLFDMKQGGQMYSGNNMLGRLYGVFKETENRDDYVVLEGSKGYLDDDGNLVITGSNDIAIQRDERYWGDILSEIDEPHVHETSYLRLREIVLSYSLPRTMVNKLFFEDVQLSVFGQNLALWTTYPNFDPETNTMGGINAQGLEYVAFPQTRSFGGKISFTF